MRVITAPIVEPVRFVIGRFGTTLVIQEGLVPATVVAELRNALEREYLPYPREEQNPSYEEEDRIIAGIKASFA